MSRSIWKGPFSLLKNKNKDFLPPQKKQNETVTVWSRNSIVLPEHIGKEFKIYNGKNWVLREIVEEMVGHKFGEFAATRKKPIHKSSKKKRK